MRREGQGAWMREGEGAGHVVWGRGKRGEGGVGRGCG